ncbi:hypothetical protein SCUCBS95973_008751 [Sporothrix curviconia]|uniref:Alpha/beta hydrolase fold-3 domain-containing protein n=1 Tax=Sporothrix curviconia TaxID=1260050 RepID=A0ABP0CQ01_9PEZI
MGSAPSADEAGTWLARRLEFAPRDDEWEQFYVQNHAHVPSLEGPVDQVRQIMLNTKMRGQGKAAPIDAGLTVEDASITTENEQRQLALRVYRPDADAHSPPLPAMLYFHGGGFALGDLDGEDRTCRALCVGSHVVVVGVDYRLAPEHPYPAALDDSWEALEWQKAAVLAQQAPARGVTLHGQLLRIPVVCQSKAELLSRGLLSMDEMHDSPILSRGAMEQFLQWYCPPSVADPAISPLLAPASTLAAVPRAYFQLCGRDPLRDEGLAYADALAAAGVPIRVNVYAGMPHAFWIFPEISKTHVAAKELLGGVKWLLEGK